MADYLFDQGASFALLVFGLTALAVVGVVLLLYRFADAAKRRRSKMATVPSEGQPEQASRAYPVGSYEASSLAQPPQDPAAIMEIRLRDANHSLFMVLMDCCNMISEVGEGSSPADNAAFTHATNIRQSGRAAMSNTEIADHAYQLAADLRPLSDPVVTAIRRVLTQLALAERWEVKLRGG